MAKPVKTCSHCIHKPVCKIHAGEMLKRFGETAEFDIKQEVATLEKSLAKVCEDFLSREA